MRKTTSTRGWVDAQAAYARKLHSEGSGPAEVWRQLVRRFPGFCKSKTTVKAFIYKRKKAAPKLPVPPPADEAGAFFARWAKDDALPKGKPFAPLPGSKPQPLLIRNVHGKIEANAAHTESGCRWPVDHAGETCFCMNRRVLGLEYCEAHARRAYSGPNARRPRARLLRPLQARGPFAMLRQSQPSTPSLRRRRDATTRLA